MVQNCDNDILDGLAVANLPQTQNPLFLSWRDWRLSLLFLSKPTIEVKCSLIDEYVKKPSAHGTSTFNGSSVLTPKIPSVFLTNSVVFHLLGGIHFSTKKSMRN
jgi:hypothetical protein